MEPFWILNKMFTTLAQVQQVQVQPVSRMEDEICATASLVTLAKFGIFTNASLTNSRTCARTRVVKP